MTTAHAWVLIITFGILTFVASEGVMAFLDYKKIDQ